jgi:hypothetical protein
MAIAIVSYIRSAGWIEVSIPYDTNGDNSTNFTLSFSLNRTIPAPVYVYYDLKKFYQNHFRFASSRSIPQLRGELPSEGDLNASCNGDDDASTNTPCGLRALGVFSDYFDLPPNFSKRGVAWSSEGDKLYGQLQNRTNATRWMREIPELENETHSEKFIVWERTAPRVHFKKLYAKGVENETMVNGTEYNITVHKLWNVSGVHKRLVFAHNGKAGGRNLVIIIANSVLAVGYAFFAFLAAVLLTPKRRPEREEMSAMRVGLTIEPV